MIKSQYQCRKDGEELVFPANAERTAPEIVEMIIRANGAAMTLDQIYQEFYRLYPNKNKRQTHCEQQYIRTRESSL